MSRCSSAAAPKTPTFDRAVERAARFDSVEDALLDRSGLLYLLGDTDKYRVHDMMPDGNIKDVEA